MLTIAEKSTIKYPSASEERENDKKVDQTRFLCNRALYWNVISDGKLYITICHELWHEGANLDTEISVEDVSFIQVKSAEGLARVSDLQYVANKESKSCVVE